MTNVEDVQVGTWQGPLCIVPGTSYPPFDSSLGYRVFVLKTSRQLVRLLHFVTRCKYSQCTEDHPF